MLTITPPMLLMKLLIINFISSFCDKFSFSIAIQYIFWSTHILMMVLEKKFKTDNTLFDTSCFFCVIQINPKKYFSGPSNDHSYYVWFQLAQLFQRKLKETITFLTPWASWFFFVHCWSTKKPIQCLISSGTVVSEKKIKM